MSIFWSVEFFILYVFIACGLYVHYRGTVRHKFSRQLLDHSTIMGPYNCFVYATTSVPNTPFIDMEHFPDLKLLEDNWETIRDEGLRLFDEGYLKQAAKDNDLAFHSFFRTGWKRFYLKWYGGALPSAKALCPKTVELVQQIPGINAAMYTFLPVGAKLGEHRDPFAGSVRYHLGLRTPNNDDCFIAVDGTPYSWRDGEGVVFDETFIHSAVNRTDVDRLILFCDVERPLKYGFARTINRWFKRIAVSAASTENIPGDGVGGLNRAFEHVYKLRRKAKALKKTNRRLYYLLKWLILGALLALIFIPWRSL